MAAFDTGPLNGQNVPAFMAKNAIDAGFQIPSLVGVAYQLFRIRTELARQIAQ